MDRNNVTPHITTNNFSEVSYIFLKFHFILRGLINTYFHHHYLQSHPTMEIQKKNDQTEGFKSQTDLTSLYMSIMCRDGT